MFGIGRYLLERFRRRPKQNAVHDAFVLQCQGTDFCGQGKHHVEIGNRQQLGLPGLQPSSAGYRLTLRTVAVAARVVLDPLVSAVVAALYMSAQFRGTATNDRAQDLTLFRPQRVIVPGDESRLTITEHIGDFETISHQAASSCGGEVVPVGSFAAVGTSSKSIMLGASRNSSSEMCV